MEIAPPAPDTNSLEFINSTNSASDTSGGWAGGGGAVRAEQEESTEGREGREESVLTVERRQESWREAAVSTGGMERREERLPESSEVVIDSRSQYRPRLVGGAGRRGPSHTSPPSSLYVNQIFEDGAPCGARGCPLNPQTRVSAGPVTRHAARPTNRTTH